MRNFYGAPNPQRVAARLSAPDDRSSSSESEAHEDVLIGTRGSGCNFCVRTVHMSPKTPGQRRDLRGHTDVHRCCGKSLMGTALVSFDVR